MTDHTETRRDLGHHPREVMGRALDHLAHLHGCSGAAVLHVERDQPTVEAVRTIRPCRMCALVEVWPKALPMLKAGTTCEGDDYVLTPLLGRGGLVGALWLDGPSRFDAGGQFRRYCDGLAVNLVAARKMGPETSPVRLVSDRVALEEALQSEGGGRGSITRVARLLGVTRKTVYNRMDRFGIARPR